MIYITQNSTNTFVLQLNDSVTLTNPFFIFDFIDVYQKRVTFSISNISPTTAYNKFIYTDGSDNQLQASGTVNVYESAVDASSINIGTMNLLRTDMYKYIIPLAEEEVVDVSIMQAYEYTYNPQWLTGEIPQQGVPASKVITDSNHRFVTDSYLSNASLGNYATNSSVNIAFLTNASLGLANNSYATNASVNSALLPIRYAGFTVCNSINYTVDASDSLGIIDTSGNMTVTLPNSLSTGFQSTIINAGNGVITLNASTLYTMDTSTKLSKQYTAASIVHKGSGVWYAFGYLKSL